MSANSFDDRAATWDDDPAKRQRAEAVAASITKVVSVGSATRMLEYGAGTGLVTQALRASVGPVTLADTSAGMRDVIHRKIAEGAITGARVWAVDLAVDPPPDERFDLIVTVMTMHHIHELEPVLSKFRGLLDAGGHLCIVDLVKEDGSFHGEGFAGHHGFDTATLASDLAAAGFRDVRVEPCSEVVRDGHSFPLFLAVATA